MKKYWMLILLLMANVAAYACVACTSAQPKALRGITHGTGPDSNWDFLIVAIAIVIVLLTLFYSVKWLIRPGETSDTHIKAFILTNE